MNINSRYQNIIKKCRFVAKTDSWFVAGTKVRIIGDAFNEFYNSNKFGDGWGLFEGLTTGHITIKNGTQMLDQETCNFEEFLIIDEFGNEISELTLSEYEQLIRDIKINSILE